ncbi:MAG: hypothetical protein JWP89_298 [Schlesneria sp.]|nr:hypothetical protein [Schlesneria sp.]
MNLCHHPLSLEFPALYHFGKWIRVVQWSVNHGSARDRCLFLGATVLGSLNRPPVPASAHSRLVGKIISIQWGGILDFAPSLIFRIHDADAATGLICISSYNDDQNQIWIHPSKFLSFTVLTEEEANAYLENQATEAREREKRDERVV